MAETSSADSRTLLQIRDDDDPLDRRQPGDDLRHLVENRSDLAVVTIRVDGEQDARLDLSQAIEHAVHAEVGRARGPDRAQRRCAEHRDDRLGHVGHVGSDAIAGDDPASGQCAGDARCKRMQAGVRDHPLHFVLAPEHERVAVVVGAPPLEQVLREVELGVRKPARAWHAVGVEQHPVARCSRHPAVIPHFAPELLLVVDRPLPQRPVGSDIDAVLRCDGRCKCRRFACATRWGDGSQRLVIGRSPGKGAQQRGDQQRGIEHVDRRASPSRGLVDTTSQTLAAATFQL